MLFVGGFLPLFLFFSFIQKEIRGKNLIFLFFSLVFLLFQGLLSFFVLSLLALLSFYLGKQVRKQGKNFFFSSLLLLCLPLLYCKYSSHLTFLPVFVRGVMPFGISFYTFRFLSYLADCRKEGKAEENFFAFALYAYAFPLLSEGPILRYEEMREEIRQRSITMDKLSQGLFRFSYGLFKKLVLADALGKLAASFYTLEKGNALSAGGEIPSFLAVFLSSLSFMLQIYLDFSAYTDMAIGIGKMAGFSIPENFRFPYEAQSIRAFWRRWHISLSLFFRDYVYIPLGGNRVSFWRRIGNLLVVWVLTGMWHGAGFNFILWGLYFFLLIVFELVLQKWMPVLSGKVHRLPKGCKGFLWRCFPFLRHLYTLIAIYFSWILFRYSDFSALKKVLLAHFFVGVRTFADEKTILLFRNHIFLLLLSMVFSSSVFMKMDAIFQDLIARGKLRKERRERWKERGVYGIEDELEAVEEKEREERRNAEEGLQEGIVQEEIVPEEQSATEPGEEWMRHQRLLRRIQRKTRWRIFLLDYGEKIYYTVKLILAVMAILLAFSAMAGQSYTPFLYNQF